MTIVQKSMVTKYFEDFSIGDNYQFPCNQNTALQFLGLDLIYIAIPCESQDLALVINSLKKVNCKGLNITIPYKEKVFYL